MAPKPLAEPVKVLFAINRLVVLRFTIEALVNAKPEIVVLLATVRVPFVIVGFRFGFPAP